MTKGHHDIGGDDAYGPVPQAELPWQYWEKRVEAIRGLLGGESRRLVSLDEVRLAYESFSLEQYQSYSFYRRRFEAMLNVLIDKGVVGREEFERELAAVKRDHPHDPD